MMYLPLIGKVEQLLAESDQQNLGNDDTCKKNTEQGCHAAISYPKIHMLDIVFICVKLREGRISSSSYCVIL